MKDVLMTILFSYMLFGSGLSFRPKEMTIEDKIKEVVEFVKNNSSQVSQGEGSCFYEKVLESEGLRFILEYVDTSASGVPNGTADERDTLYIHVIDTKDRPKWVFVRKTIFIDSGLDGYFSRTNDGDRVDYGAHYVTDKGLPIFPKDWSQEQLKMVQEGYGNALRDIRAEIRKFKPNRK